MFARAIITIFGLGFAATAALIFMPLAAVFDPFVQSMVGGLAPENWFEIFGAILMTAAPDETVSTIFHLIWMIAMLICVLPVTLVALLGALGRVRSYVFYAVATGILAAAMPWIVRAGRMAERSASMTPAEGHIALILFLTGVVAGSVYWLIAGRDPRRARNEGWRATQPNG